MGKYYNSIKNYDAIYIYENTLTGCTINNYKKLFLISKNNEKSGLLHYKHF